MMHKRKTKLIHAKTLFGYDKTNLIKWNIPSDDQSNYTKVYRYISIKYTSRIQLYAWKIDEIFLLFRLKSTKNV
jgi:ABC-type lipoprotein release transport system permease subunit